MSIGTLDRTVTEQRVIQQLASRESLGGIRPLNPSRDLGHLADLIEDAFGEELSNGGERVLRDIRLLGTLGPLNWLFAGMSSEVDGIFNSFVWEDDGRIAGNVTISRPTGHPKRWQISNVAVLKDYQGRGIARQLLEKAIAQVLQRGGQAVYLFVRQNNAPALHLYRSLGFSELERTTDLRFNPPAVPPPSGKLAQLRQLKPGEGKLLYDLVSRVAGPGHRWLYAIRKRRFDLSNEDRFFRWLGSFFSGERETLWGVLGSERLEVGLTLCARRLWNPKPHQLRLWVDPHRRSPDDILAKDIVQMLHQQTRRPADLSVPAEHESVVQALAEHGFRKLRTLILMKLEL